MYKVILCVFSLQSVEIKADGRVYECEKLFFEVVFPIRCVVLVLCQYLSPRMRSLLPIAQNHRNNSSAKISFKTAREKRERARVKANRAYEEQFMGEGLTILTRTDFIKKDIVVSEFFFHQNVDSMFCLHHNPFKTRLL